uniref:Uncharacterized protein n=1 Tax=Rhipicephalus zambeziensis TaxID=60191 RepID=A0A224Y6Y8_9ACAR
MLSAQLPLGNTKWIEAAAARCFGKTSKLHRSKQPQQFLSLNSTCSQIGTSCSSVVSGNSVATVPQWQRRLLFCWPQILCSSVIFFFFFSVHRQGNVGKLPGELKAPG